MSKGINYCYMCGKRPLGKSTFCATHIIDVVEKQRVEIKTLKEQITLFQQSLGIMQSLTVRRN